MGAPQIIWIALIAWNIVHTGFHHGEPETGNHNVGVAILAAGISFAIVYWGGFFG